MAPRIDLSPLYNRPPPSALQTGMANVGDIMTAMMERRRRQEQFDAEQEAKRQELQFRRDQESRLTKRQEMLDQRDNEREDRRDQRAATTAIVGAKPQDRAFVAQAYGGTVAPAKPNYLANPEDPLGPNIDLLENVQDDESSPLGFSYGVNPEHERRTQEAANTQVVTLPGGQQMNLPAGEAKAAHFAKLRAVIASLPEGPDKAMRMRSLQEAEALGLENEDTGNYLRQNAALFGQDQRAAAALAARAKKGGGRGGAGKPSDVRGDFTAFRGAATQWETAANVDKLTDSWDKFRELSSNVEDANRSGDTISRKSALYQAARYITGPGVLTPAEFENTVQRTGGSIGSLLTELEKRKSGDISDIEAAALEKFVTNAKAAVQRRAANAVKDYDRRFGAGLAAKNPTMKEERDAYRSSLLQRFEIEDPSAPKGNAVGTPKALMKPADLDRLNRIKVR